MTKRRKWIYAALYWPSVTLLWVNRRRALPQWLWARAASWNVLGEAVLWPTDENADYRFRQFGDRLDRIPNEVNIGGIRHRVQIAEGMVIFSQTSGFYGTHSRICFERGSDGMLWYLKFSETWDRIPVAHVLKAWDYVQVVYGGDFEIRKDFCGICWSKIKANRGEAGQ